ncbi:MAG: WD40 repeat domain-containing protein [Planctomycetaceae bacterium]
MQTFDLFPASYAANSFPLVRLVCAVRHAAPIQRVVADTAHHEAHSVWRLLITVVFLTVALLSLMPLQAAERDGVLQCDTVLGSVPVFTPDGRWLFGVGYKKTSKTEGVGTLCGWNVESEKLVLNLAPHGTWMTDVAVSQDGRWLVIFAGPENVGSIWSVQSTAIGKTGPLLLAGSFRHYVLPSNVRASGSIAGQVAVAPSSREFASVCGKRVNNSRSDFEVSIKVWPMPDESASKTNPRSSANAKDKSTSNALNNSSRSQSVATVESDAEAQSGYQPRLKIPVDNYPIDMTYSPDGKFLVAGFWAGPPSQRNQAEVHFLDSETGELKNKWKLNGQFKSHFYGYRGSLAYSPDGKHLLICFAGEAMAEVWDVQSERAIWSGQSRLGFRKGAFSPDGKLLALSSKDYEVQLLRFPECEVISVGVTPQNGTTIAFSPDGKSLATFWKSNSFKLWNVDELLAQKRWWLDKKPGQRNAEITQPKSAP